jgi:hypothetical protein
VDGNGGHRWDDDRLMTLLTRVRDDEEDDGAEAPVFAGRSDRSTGMSLEDVVAAGRAAFCWLDVVVTLRNVTRHHGLAAGASTAREPGH